MTCSTSYYLCDTLLNPWNVSPYMFMYGCRTQGNQTSINPAKTQPVNSGSLLLFSEHAVNFQGRHTQRYQTYYTQLSCYALMAVLLISFVGLCLGVKFLDFPFE
jgi:hypothetical protein